MKTIYEAANLLEAQMLADVLRQEGVTAQVMGSFLPGAVGELPAAGLVRLVVEEEDADRARAVIARWEATQVNEPAPRTAGVTPSRPAWLWGLGGLVVGAGLCFAWLRVPLHQTGFDHNRDSQIDERWEYSLAGVAVSAEFDRNFDNKFDLRYRYDAHGNLGQGESDDNFDGIYETKTVFLANQPQQSEADTDGDGLVDLATRFIHGVISSVHYLEPRSGRATRIEHIKLGRLDRAETDTDLDGALDTREHYNTQGQITRTERLSTP